MQISLYDVSLQTFLKNEKNRPTQYKITSYEYHYIFIRLALLFSKTNYFVAVFTRVERLVNPSTPLGRFPNSVEIL